MCLFDTAEEAHGLARQAYDLLGMSENFKIAEPTSASGVPQLTIGENGQRKTIYLTKEQREELERIKMANGLRSLKEAYDVWKQAKQIAENNNENVDVRPGILEDPDIDEFPCSKFESWLSNSEESPLQYELDFRGLGTVNNQS